MLINLISPHTRTIHLSSPVIIAIPGKPHPGEPMLPDDDTIMYLGSSMGSTFMPGDLLGIRKDTRIRLGDVIVYREPGGDRYIIHRVIGIIPGGFLTRGDHNPVPDTYVVDPSRIVGKVVTKNRSACVTQVQDGLKGMVQGRYIHIVQTLIWFSAPAVKPIYRLLIRHQTPGIRLLRFLTLQPVVLVKEGIPEIHLYLNGHQAGFCTGHERPWQIRPMFRLLIDPDHLPAFGEIVRQALEVSSRRQP